MTLIDLLHTRRSTSSRFLGEPGPTPDQLLTMLEAAVRVPDHGRLTPWRFLRIAGTARHALGDALASRARDLDPSAPDSIIDKERQRFAHAPVVLAVIARLTPGHRIPEQEQLLSGGAVCFSLLLAAQSLGFGAQWLTGWAAYDPAIAGQLGLAEHERVLGFIHIGSPSEAAPERVRPDPRDLLSDWTPS